MNENRLIDFHFLKSKRVKTMNLGNLILYDVKVYRKIGCLDALEKLYES